MLQVTINEKIKLYNSSLHWFERLSTLHTYIIFWEHKNTKHIFFIIWRWTLLHKENDQIFLEGKRRKQTDKQKHVLIHRSIRSYNHRASSQLKLVYNFVVDRNC